MLVHELSCTYNEFSFALIKVRSLRPDVLGGWSISRIIAVGLASRLFSAGSVGFRTDGRDGAYTQRCDQRAHHNLDGALLWPLFWAVAFCSNASIYKHSIMSANIF